MEEKGLRDFYDDSVKTSDGNISSLVMTNGSSVTIPGPHSIVGKQEAWSFEKEFGFNPPRPLGDKICIQQYVKRLLSDSIVAAETTLKMQKCECIVGRIVRLGSTAFKSDYFKDWPKEDFPKVGDWVTFKINAGVWYKYGPQGKGVTVMTIFDDAINDKVEDPSYVDRE